MSPLGHSRPGGTSSISSHVRYASDRYRNGEALKLTRRAQHPTFAPNLYCGTCWLATTASEVPDAVAAICRPIANRRSAAAKEMAVGPFFPWRRLLTAPTAPSSPRGRALGFAFSDRTGLTSRIRIDGTAKARTPSILHLFLPGLRPMPRKVPAPGARP